MSTVGPPPPPLHGPRGVPSHVPVPAKPTLKPPPGPPRSTPRPLRVRDGFDDAIAPSRLSLRLYQQRADVAVEAGWREVSSQLCVMATGTGKTWVAAAATDRELLRGDKVLFIGHTEELLSQPIEKFAAVGIETVLEKAHRRASSSRCRVVVASLQTLVSRLSEWPSDAFSLIIIDECHRSAAKSYQRILEHFADARVLGLTATPYRADQKSLAKIFERVAFEYGFREAVNDCWLCRPSCLQLGVSVDLSDVRIRRGDFDSEDLSRCMEPVLRTLAEAVSREIGDRRTLIFLPTVEASKQFAELLLGLGVAARYVHGVHRHRKKIVEAFKGGKIQCLCNASLLTEGFDCPEVSCVVILRPTRSRGLYQQMVGRGTRTHPSKKDLLVIDPLWESRRDELCTPASLIARNEDEARRISAYLHPGKPVDLFEIEERYDQEWFHSLLEGVSAPENRNRTTIDYEEFAAVIGDIGMAKYEAVLSWEKLPPTAKQKRILKKMGYCLRSIRTRGQASRAIAEGIRRRELGLGTPKQVNALVREGVDPKIAANMGFHEATETLTRIRAESRRPTYG